MWFGLKKCKKGMVKQSFFNKIYLFWLLKYYKLYIFNCKRNLNIINIFFLEKTYFFNFSINNRLMNYIYFNYSLNCLVINFFFLTPLIKIFFSQWFMIFFSFTKLFFLKLRFKGKGYYLYKNYRNTLAPQFNYSHKINIYLFNIQIKFLAKTIFFLLSYNYHFIIQYAYIIKHIRSSNIFTNRGIRLAKQIVFKKTGKVSQYR